MLSMTEPTLAEGVQAIHRQGWYMTFAYTWGAPESFASGTELLRRFLRHTLKQAVQHDVVEQLRPRCERILSEARERGCLFLACDDRRDTIVLTFNNGVDMQYTRTLGHVRLWKKYGIYPDWVYLKVAVRNFFLYQDDIQPMYHGVPRHINKLAGVRKHA